jgi:hypothetical protein
MNKKKKSKNHWFPPIEKKYKKSLRILKKRIKE